MPKSVSGMSPHSTYKSSKGSNTAEISKQESYFLSTNSNPFFNASGATSSVLEVQRKLTTKNLGINSSVQASRKLSLQPLIGQHSPADYLASTTHEMSPLTALPFRRSSFQAKRLSEVGLEIGQQLTAKIGLKLPASQERVVEQTRWLCLRYIYMKFRQNSMPTRKLALNRLKPSIKTTLENEGESCTTRKYHSNPSMNNQIFIELVNMIKELQTLAPSFYGNTIYEHIGIDKFTSCRNLLNVQKTICQELTRSEITWCRIAALFAIFGAMSLDCLRLGQPEYVCPLLEGFLDFVERDLAWWISQQGGWEAYLYKYQLGSIQQIAFKALTVFLLLTASISILISSLS